MSLRKVANVVGLLQIFVSFSMFFTALIAVSYGGADARGFVVSGVLTLVAGLSVYLATRFDGEITTREGFAIVTMAWTAWCQAHIEDNGSNTAWTFAAGFEQ